MIKMRERGAPPVLPLLARSIAWASRPGGKTSLMPSSVVLTLRKPRRVRQPKLWWGKDGPAVIFQDVVHSIGTGEADCDEQSSFPGQTEWTSTRMPDSLFAVERRWSKPSFAAWVSALPQPAFA